MNLATINSDGNVVLDLGTLLTDHLTVEQKRELLKRLSVSSDVIEWVIAYICGEDDDGWYDGRDADIRQKLLQRVEKAQMKDALLKYKWSVFEELERRLREIKSIQHIYWKLYHHPNKYKTTIAEFIHGEDVQKENEFQTQRAEKEIEECLEIWRQGVERALNEKTHQEA